MSCKGMQVNRLKKIRKSMSDMNENITKEIELVTNCQTENLEIKS